MFPEERRHIITEILRKQGRCRVDDLAGKLQVSEVTVRQDLDILEREGMLRRTHGGAILNPQSSFERSFQLEATYFAREKERIGQAAAALVEDGATIILDVGTTVTQLARNLTERKDLTVFTNALNIAMLLEDAPGVELIVTGGTLRRQQHSLVNPFGSLITERINADMVFIGCNGIDAEHGLTNVNLAEAEMKTLFIKAARHRVVLADSSKVGNAALVKFAALQDINLLITDDHVAKEEVLRLTQLGVEVQAV